MFYADPDTGEVVGEKQTYIDKIFDEEEGYLCWNRRSSFRSFLDVPLPDTLSWADKGRADRLKHFMLKDNQLLVYRSGNTIKPLGVAQIAKHLELNERNAKRFINKLKKCGVIKEVSINKQVFYMLNPKYFFKGKRLTSFVYIAFQEELKKELEPWVVLRFSEQAKEITDIRVVK